jgi:MoaA/NifB/PqqE/SkfB family radical SAM enzyme
VPAPRADLKVGFACNNRCVFCAQGDKRERCGALPLPSLFERLEAARAVSDSLVLTGGEPTVHRHIVRLVRAARARGFRHVQLQTNGRMLAYPHVLAALLQAGVTEISPSLHGSSAVTHDALTCAPGSFEETVAGIRNAVAAGVLVVSNSVVTRRNLAELDAIVTLLGELGVRHVQLAFVHPVGAALERFDEVVPWLSELHEPLAAALAAARAFGVRLVTEAVPLCCLTGMRELAVEAAIPPTVVLDLDQQVDYARWRRELGKAHGPPCERCALRLECEGPWREYPEHRGWAELRPIEDRP